MHKRDNSILQKMNDNIFYVALGLGLLAILAVVAIYTMRQSGGSLAQDERDVKHASEYASVEQEDAVLKEQTPIVDEIAKDDANVTTDPFQRDGIDVEEIKAIEEASSQQASQIQEKERVEETVTQEKAEQKEADSASTVPAAADAGELNFNSEKTISWPVSGAVILPFSMDTTVYFKTLDQYRCNPGMLIGAGKGTTVTSAFLGKVTKVTSDNLYGNTVSMYLGNNYTVTYGQLDAVYVKEGDYVKAGESVGTVGTPTDSFLEEGSHLFFQMMDGETPVDPVLYME